MPASESGKLKFGKAATIDLSAQRAGRGRKIVAICGA
jgi:hypothetical protein